ncbi:MAG: phage tail assembly protein [Arenicella sp.]
MKDITVKLSRPLVDQEGKEHTEIVLSEPTGSQWDAIGKPFSVFMKGDQQIVDISNTRLTNYVSAVSGIDQAVLRSLPLSDLQKLQDEMMNFFGEADTDS